MDKEEMDRIERLFEELNTTIEKMTASFEKLEKLVLNMETTKESTLKENQENN